MKAVNFITGYRLDIYSEEELFVYNYYKYANKNKGVTYAVPKDFKSR